MASKSHLVTRRRAPVGTPPGTLIADERASPTTIRMIVIDDKGAVETHNATLADVERAKAGRKRLWVDVTGLADIALIQRIGEMFGINELALEDISNTNQRPKVDVFGDHALVVAHMFERGTVDSKEQYAIVFDKRHVVTFQERPGDCLDPVRRRLQSPVGMIRKRGSAYLVYAILDTIVDAYFPMLEKIGDALEDIESAIMSDPQPSDVTQLHALKRELLVVKRALWPSREMLSSMTREDVDVVPEAVNVFLRDTYDHVVQLIDIVETYREVATGLIDLYLSSVSTKMNEVMKVLTIISTIFIPLGFLAGVWGMNFDPSASPWNMPELGFYYGYPAALGIMTFVVVALLIVFRRKKWL